jgi:hypothetical protein
MSETLFSILFAPRSERNGYGVIQHVEELTEGRVVLGAGDATQLKIAGGIFGVMAVLLAAVEVRIRRARDRWTIGAAGDVTARDSDGRLGSYLADDAQRNLPLSSK